MGFYIASIDVEIASKQLSDFDVNNNFHKKSLAKASFNEPTLWSVLLRIPKGNWNSWIYLSQLYGFSKKFNFNNF